METILVVDDENRIREQYAQILSNEGFTVLKAPDAVSANELLRNAHINLVLLDINMAGIDGAELAELLRSFHRDIKLIVSSVYPLEEQRERIPDADDYFDKSEGLRSLLNKIRLHTGKPSSEHHIVIVDDDRRTRILFSRILETAGYDVIGFSDNEKALLHLTDADSKVDVVLLDIEMPTISGNEFFEMIRTFHPQAKILVFSAHPVEEQRSAIHQADGYFDKSDGSHALLIQVKKLALAPAKDRSSA